MRAGRLRHRVDILELGHDLSPIAHGQAWVGIVSKENSDVPVQTGLRASAKVSVHARNRDILEQGIYLKCDNRLLHITSARDAIGNRAGLYISCDEFIGRQATYYPQGTTPKNCRVHLIHDAPYLDDFGKVTDYRTKAEVLLIEVGRPQENDRITISGKTYIVTQYASDTDDGVVRGLWLEAVE